jgi:hypothetical protein
MESVNFAAVLAGSRHECLKTTESQKYASSRFSEPESILYPQAHRAQVERHATSAASPIVSSSLVTRPYWSGILPPFDTVYYQTDSSASALLQPSRLRTAVTNKEAIKDASLREQQRGRMCRGITAYISQENKRVKRNLAGLTATLTACHYVLLTTLVDFSTARAVMITTATWADVSDRGLWCFRLFLDEAGLGLIGAAASVG